MPRSHSKSRRKAKKATAKQNLVSPRDTPTNKGRTIGTNR
jgi:hypothetical protein